MKGAMLLSLREDYYFVLHLPHSWLACGYLHQAASCDTRFVSILMWLHRALAQGSNIPNND
jgi:hypothetical protein